MRFNSDMASIHAYLCSDGYVIRNPTSQKHKYYHIGLRNTDQKLLEDFQRKFHRQLKIKPIIAKDGRCRIQSKKIYYYLTKNHSYYSDKWSLPKMNNRCIRSWLRSYFDCDGWVELQKAKSRSVRLDSINENGLRQIQKSLSRLSIESSVKYRKGILFRLSICGLDDLKKFHRSIGFLHEKKNQRLIEAIESYKTYKWEIDEGNIRKLIDERGRKMRDRDAIRLMSIKKNNLIMVNKILNIYKITNRIYGPWKSGQGSLYYCLIFKESELNKIPK